MGAIDDGAAGVAVPAWLARLAWAALLSMLVVTTASAWLRLSQARAPCDDWPACRTAIGRSERLVQPPRLAEPRGLAAVRAVHRVAASAVLLAVLALVAGLARAPKAGASIGALRDAVAMLALALALAALGVATPGSRAAPVLLGNLLGGLAMLAFAARLATRLAPAAAYRGEASPGFIRDARIGVALWGLQAALGAWAGSGSGGLSAPAHAAAGFFVAAWTWHAAGGAGDPRAVPLVRILRGLAAGQAALGVAGASLHAPPAAVLPHNLVAALGIAAMAAATALRPARGS